MNPATATEPHRNHRASLTERTTGSRIEFDQWRAAHPDFTSAELLENWRRIRAEWGLAHDRSKATA